MSTRRKTVSVRSRSAVQINSKPGLAKGAGASRIALLALALLFGIMCAQPALAQFSVREGFAADGNPQLRVEIQPYLWLPNTDSKVGLGRFPGLDPSVSRGRPTLADIFASVRGAFTCNCLVRYGNWSGEVNLSYLSVGASKAFAPIVPMGPGALLTADVSDFFIAPGFGYRVLHTTAPADLALDLRAGFTYNSVRADTTFQRAGLFSVKGRSNDFIQPWLGERFDYYPSPRWRLENTAAVKGLGVDGGAIGWNAQVTVSYLVSKYFDISAGYNADQTVRHPTSRFDENNTLNILAYGPYFALGFRF